MRRFYYSTPKKQKLKQQALLNLRKARRNVDPDLLERLRGLIENQAKRHAPPDPKEDDAGKVAVDRRKNLSIIMKFLELQPDRAVRLQVRTLLNEELN
jgi:hypothetical protein